MECPIEILRGQMINGRQWGLLIPNVNILNRLTCSKPIIVGAVMWDTIQIRLLQMWVCYVNRNLQLLIRT